MKNSLFATLLAIIPVFCQAELLTRRFVVEFQQDADSLTQSFSIKSDLNAQPRISSDIADTNGYPGSDFLSVDKRHGLSGYGLKTAFIRSIPWQWLYATNLLVAHELILTIHDAALGAKPISWLPLEAFVLVGLLLKSYWSPGSLRFDPLEKPEAASLMKQGDEPFSITRMMLPGNNQQQNGQRNQQSSSSGQQASGTTSTQLSGYSSSHLSSGSGGGNEGPEQRQHTLGLDCYFDSCQGVCKLRSSTDSKESAEGPLNAGVLPAQFSSQSTDIRQTISHDRTGVAILSINSERSIVSGMRRELIDLVGSMLWKNRLVCAVGTSGRTRGQLQLEVMADYDCTQEERQELSTYVERFLRENVPERLRNEFKVIIKYEGPVEPL
ncbi:hypothetical protein [Endozoicomonas sp. ALD040]|uniref:hypothetical protein n=1 Tax=unclassified Endozoicomonas TaxID=2644528 RepID=UPI003BB02442